jgi:hypothetical protein
MSRSPSPSELDALLRQLADDDPLARCAAAEELERRHCRAETAVVGLTRALDDPDPRVVLAATRALRRAVGRWRTDELVYAKQRPFVATGHLARAVAKGEEVAPAVPPTPPAPVTPSADDEVPADSRPLPGLRAAVRRGDAATRRGLAELARRLEVPATERMIAAVTAIAFFLLLALAAAALGRVHFLFVTHLFDAPAVAVGGAVITTIALGGLLLLALARVLDRPRISLLSVAAVVGLLGLFTAFSVVGFLTAFEHQAARVFLVR